VDESDSFFSRLGKGEKKGGEKKFTVGRFEEKERLHCLVKYMAGFSI